MASKITGDVPVSKNTKAVSLVNLAIVPEADLTKADASINIYSESGKEEGAAVCVKFADGTYGLAIASGRDPSDAWNVIGKAAVGG